MAPQNSGIIAGKGTSGAGDILSSETLLAGVSAALSVHRYSSTECVWGCPWHFPHCQTVLGKKLWITVELGCSSALELFPPWPEVDVHGQPSLLSKIVILSNPVVLDCKCALETNPLCAHDTQIWRGWQDSPVFPAFPHYCLLLGSGGLWRWCIRASWENLVFWFFEATSK